MRKGKRGRERERETEGRAGRGVETKRDRGGERRERGRRGEEDRKSTRLNASH